MMIEKKHAIDEMDIIYKCARKVVIVLEDIVLSANKILLLKEIIVKDDDEKWALP